MFNDSRRTSTVALLFSEHESEGEAALKVGFCLLKEKQLWLVSEISV